MLLASATGFRPSSATSCPNKCQDIGAQGASHKFSETGSNYKCEPFSCHTTELPGQRVSNHEVCIVSFREARRDIEAIVATVAEQNAEEITAVLQRYDDAVQYNARRNAVQVFACDGSVLAHLPVDADVGSRL